MTLTPQRLSKLIDNSLAKTKQQRQFRVKALTQIVGRFYRNGYKAGDEVSKASPINLMYTAYTTLIPNLVFGDPKAKIGIDILAYRDYANQLSAGVNHVSKKQNLRGTMRLVVADAILMAGYVKTGLAIGTSMIQLEGVDFNLTEPFAERVSPDDMILDSMARSWDEQAIVGNKYRADVDKLLEEGFGDADKLNKLADDLQYNAGNERAEDITRQSKNTDEPRRYVELAEIWIPAEQRVVTVPYKAGSTMTDFIADIEYGGPPKGQYHQLGLVDVPDNVLPGAPAGIWFDLHMMGNRIARKLARQAERNKRVLAYEDDAEEDVNAIADGNDGETVRVQNLDKIKEVEYGGAPDKSYEWMAWVKQNFGEQAGNIEQLSGQGSDAGTLGQAEMIQANTSVRLGDMQGIVYDFVGQVLGDVGYYLHTDPLIELPLVRRIEGVETQDYLTPDTRVGEWYQYNVTTEPYSLARPDPNMAVRRKLEFATNVIPAAVNAAMQLGPGFKLGPYLTTMAREVGIEDADEWLNTAEMAAFIQQKMLASLMTGDPGKAGGKASAPAPAVTLPFNPAQPNPAAMGPTGGVSPSTEKSMAAQEAAGDIQSTRALASIRGQ